MTDMTLMTDLTYLTILRNQILLKWQKTKQRTLLYFQRITTGGC